MRRTILMTLAAMALFGGCVTVEKTSAPAGTLYRGEVWTWDERTNVVTLRNGTVNTRVRVTPDQIKLLRLHEFATVRGELAPPEELPVVATAAVPMRALAEGAPQQTEAVGAVSATDPRGLVSVDSERGRLTVWTATADTSGFTVGTPVRLRMAVQPVRMVPITDSGGSAGVAAPAASVATEPGEHAVITGWITAVDPRGAITVESPRGPISVAVTDASGFRVGQHVQVRTSLMRG